VRPTHLAVDVEHGVVVRSWDVRVARYKLLFARTERRCSETEIHLFVFPGSAARASKPHAPVAPSSARTKPARRAVIRRPSTPEDAMLLANRTTCVVFHPRFVRASSQRRARRDDA
jgi:hypothetical protein